ncbi:MAG: hypothetical protein HY593_04090 [Candidatus Omnitrophica bacterium]|nr:hypothetical protein [Candidatus Omnitrophota bacterium]
MVQGKQTGNFVWDLVLDKKFHSGSTLWVIAFLLFANLLFFRWSDFLIQERKRNLLIASAPAVSNSLTASSRPVRYDRSVGEDLERYWSFIPDAVSLPLVLLTGMSQMYMINDFREGDQTIVEWMDDALSKKGVRAFGLAAPNLSNEEAFFLLLAAASEPKTTPRVWIFGVCFDKFRNIDLRPGYRTFLKNRPPLQERWKAMADRYAERYPLATDKMKSTLSALRQEIRKTTSFESCLRERTAAWVPMVRVRKELNARIQMSLFLLRNKLLGIKPASKRPIIPSRLRMNKEFLGLAAEAAREKGIKLVVYVVPLNPQAESPYVPEQYEEFKEWLAQFALRNGLPTADWEKRVPVEEWGELMDGPDFKHFKGAGHRLTADALLDLMERSGLLP